MIMVFWRLSKFLMFMCFPFFVSSFNVWVLYFSRLNFMFIIHPKIDALDLMDCFSLSWFHTAMIKVIDKHHIPFLFFLNNSTSHIYFFLALRIWLHAQWFIYPNPISIIKIPNPIFSTNMLIEFQETPWESPLWIERTNFQL
jgi:hypothetical protein